MVKGVIGAGKTVTGFKLIRRIAKWLIGQRVYIA